MMNTAAVEAIRSRVSVRRYTDDPVSTDEIFHVLELAGQAPSAFNVQPWRFIAVTDQQTKDKLQGAAMGQPQVGSAPVVLALVSDMEATMADLDAIVHPGLPEDKKLGTLELLQNSFGGMTVEERGAFGRAQSNIALGYLLVALEALGYGSSPMLGFDADQVKQILEVPAHGEVVALVAFGRPAEPGFSKHRHDVRKITRLIAGESVEKAA